MEDLNPACRLDALPVARYRFQLAATTALHLPDYKGSTLHGGFGHALKTISPHYYKQLFDPAPTAGSFPKPFVLLPPLDRDRLYNPGRQFVCELTLFGAAIDHFSICHAALEYLGGRMGFGIGRGKFKIIAVDRDMPDPPDPTTGSDKEPSPESICIRAVTRLRLKDNDRLLSHPPPFPLFFARILGRLNSLSVCHGHGRIVTPEHKKHLMDRAETVSVSENGMAWRDWTRYSGRQKTQMKFGGLLGTATYTGDMAPFLPYLVLGQWTHVGGKTSFGLGKYEMDAGPTTPENSTPR